MDDLPEAISQALIDAVEPARLSEPLQKARSLQQLLEANMRLRKLAVQLSNMLGDLPP